VDRYGLITDEDVYEDEKAALQAIYKYLEKLGLKYTLETLVQESTIANDESGYDLDELFIVGGKVHEISEPEDLPFEEEEERQQEEEYPG
jgi:hypothetical protein